MSSLTYHSKPNETEAEHVAELVASMTANGWQGAPLVTWGEDVLVTGSHRAEAAEIAEVEPETITLEELFEEDGADYDEFLAEYNEADGDVYTGLRCLIYHLSKPIREKYGIDIQP